MITSSAKKACAVAAGVVAGMALLGCGDDGTTEPSAVAPKAAASTSPANDRTAPVAAPAVSDESAPAPEASAEGLAAGEGGNNGTVFRFVLTEVHRSGATVNVSARVEFVKGTEDRYQVSGTFADGVNQSLKAGDREAHDVFDGVALIDPQGRKKYLVARDEEGRCVCSDSLSGTFAEAGAPVTLQAVLAAPPPEVKRVDVYVPGVKTFASVPISG